MKLRLVLILLSFYYFCPAWSQEEPPNEAPYVQVEEDLDQEFNEFEKTETSETSVTEPTIPEPTKLKVQTNAVTTNESLAQPQFVKPKGPARGGVLRVPHPNAAKGLLRIEKDGSYQYKVALKEKSQSSSMRFGTMTPPKITGNNSKTFSDYYGSANIAAITVEYEWQPFQSFGRLGLNLGSGIGSVRGNGYFQQGGAKAEETYTMYLVPLTAFLTYRFEYVRRQWVVPYINGGMTYYGMAEIRDDQKFSFAGASAAGGGGGLLISISAFDPAKAFIMDREYGIADLYLSIEARVMQGLSKQVDFSNQSQSD